MEDRTTAIGLLNYGRDYLKAARYLQQKIDCGELKLSFGAPLLMLVGHGLELVFKAYLRAQGDDLQQLKNHGHDLERLLEKSKNNGLKLEIDEETTGHLSLLNHLHGKPPFQTRYIVTGLRQDPDIEILLSLGERIAKHIMPDCRAALDKQ